MDNMRLWWKEANRYFKKIPENQRKSDLQKYGDLFEFVVKKGWY